jgi:hypothetical protein
MMTATQRHLCNTRTSGETMNLTKQACAAIAAAALVVGTAGMAAAASKPSAAESPSEAPSITAGGARQRLISDDLRTQLRSTGHVEIVKHTKRRGDVTIEVQRGEITAVSGSSITVRSKDGYSHSYPVTDATKVREQRVPIAVSDLHVGERAMVVALRTKNGDVARRISCISERDAPKKTGTSNET